MDMEFWLTDHGRDLYALSIRTEDKTDRGLPVSPVVNVMTSLHGNNVTNLSVFSREDLLTLRDEIESTLGE